MDTLITGNLSRNPVENYRQAKALASLCFSFPQSVGSTEPAFNIETMHTHVGTDLVMPNPTYVMTPPEAVFYNPVDGVEAQISANALAAALSEKSGSKIPVLTFNGDLAECCIGISQTVAGNQIAAAVIDPSENRDGFATFEFSDRLRRQVLTDRTARGDDSTSGGSGLAAYGKLTPRFVNYALKAGGDTLMEHVVRAGGMTLFGNL